MKKINLKIGFIVLLIVNCSILTKSQNQSILGAWISETDNNQILVFKSNNKCYQYYSNVLVNTSDFTISNTTPQCNVNVLVDNTTNYLHLNDLSNNIEQCYLINGISDISLSMSIIDEGGVILYKKNNVGSIICNSNYINITSHISSNGTSASFYFAFVPSSVIMVGTSYLVANISPNCRPSVEQNITYYGDKTWLITIKPNGDMYFKILCCSTHYVGAGFGTITYPI